MALEEDVLFVGGLKACAWTDLIWGAALILGGIIVMWFAFQTIGERPAEELIITKVENSHATVQDLEKAGAWERITLLNSGVDGEATARNGKNLSGGKMHMIRPKEDSDIPWTALLIGLWIPNFFYWGLNQYIVQRTLGSKSLAEGQKGIVFAASLKLIIPFLVVIPGILAFNLFSKDLHESAAKKNIIAVEKVTDNESFVVDADFVLMQPVLSEKVQAHNEKLVGAEIATATTAKIAKETKKALAEVNADDSIKDKERALKNATAVATASIINELSNKAVDKGAAVGGDLKGYDYDSAFPVLVRNLIKEHWYISWFVLAALCGAVISSVASMLNSASTIATMDLYAKFTKETNGNKLVKVGKFFVVIFVLLAAMVAPKLDNFESIFKYIQEFQGFISPGLLAVFIFGFFSPRTPRWFGAVGILTNVVAYGALKWGIGSWIANHGFWYAKEIAFLDRMALCFFIVLIIGIVITLVKPMTEPAVLPENDEIPLEGSKGAQVVGGLVIAATIALYAIFW